MILSILFYTYIIKMSNRIIMCSIFFTANFDFRLGFASQNLLMKVNTFQTYFLLKININKTAVYIIYCTSPLYKIVL